MSETNGNGSADRWGGDPNPSGLCLCGCGQETTVATRSSRRAGMRKGWHHRFVRAHNTRGRYNPAWKGGRIKHSRGYWMIYSPDHPRANPSHVMEHILLAEAALGRPLPVEHPVHHVNEDPADNGPGNLVICEDTAYHCLLHTRTEALNATGDPSKLKCKICGGWDHPEAMYVYEGETPRHRRCHLEVVRRAYFANAEACRVGIESPGEIVVEDGEARSREPAEVAVS